MKTYKNLLTFQQGASWKFQMSILDDEFYKARFQDFLNLNHSLISTDIKEALLLLLTSDIDKNILYNIVLKLLNNILTVELLEQIDIVFEEKQYPALDTKKVFLYLKIFKSVGSSRTMDYKYEGDLIQGVCTFNVSALDTQSMVHKTNKNLEEPLLGYYTLELEDMDNLEVIRLLEGDLEVKRGAKNDYKIS